MKRSGLVLLLLSAIGLVLFAGGAPQPAQQPGATGSAQAAPAAQEPVTLTVASWGVQEGATQGYFEALKRDFEAANPNVTIEYQGYPYGQLRQQVLVMASAGETPDLVQVERGWMPGFVASGFFTPIDNLVSDTWKADVFPKVRDNLTIDGQLWAAPWFYSPYVMFYNADLFAKAGLNPENPPTTYEELLVAAQALSRLTDADGNQVYGVGLSAGSVPVSGSAILSTLMSFGGGLTNAQGAVAIDTPQNLAALEYYRNLHAQNLNPQAALLRELRNLFAIGRLGIYFDQFWGIGGAFAINPEVRGVTRVSPPIGTSTTPAGSPLEAHLMMVSATSENQAVAGKFIEFATSRAQLAQYFQSTPFLPAYQNAAQDPAFQNDALASRLTTAADAIGPVPVNPRMDDVLLKLTEAVQKVTLGGEQPAAVLRTLDAEIKALLQ